MHRRAVRPGSELGVLRPVHRPADVADAHRRAVAVGDDDVVPGRRGEDLIVVVDREALLRAVEGALRRVGRGVDDLRPDVLESETERCDLCGVELNAYRGLLLAVDRDLGNAADLRKLLGQDILGGIVDHRERQRGRGQRQDQDRRVRRIDLAVARRARQVGRQLSAGGIDRRLDVACGGIDVASRD